MDVNQAFGDDGNSVHPPGVVNVGLEPPPGCAFTYMTSRLPTRGVVPQAGGATVVVPVPEDERWLDRSEISMAQANLTLTVAWIESPDTSATD